jgi:hypothetical protein
VSRRWTWWLAWSLWLGSVTLFAAGVTLQEAGPMNEGEPAWPDNPLGVEGLDRAAAERVVLFTFLATLAASAASMVVRFRRSRGDERLQLKWMTYVVVVHALSAAIQELGSELSEFTFPAALALLPSRCASRC